MKRVVIVGGGFAGINCAKALAKRRDLEVCLIDRRNHHLFQPLLYQVAMAGLSPADIASPIRSLLSGHDNARVVQAEVTRVEPECSRVLSTAGQHVYDYLVLATGAQHTYFGHEEWEPHAPGLKTLEQATEIRRRVLSAFERAECEPDPSRRRALLTFVVVGAGPTGVELAGAIGEMTRFTLGRDFRNIDPKLTRIVLIEAGPRVLPSFDERLSSRATRELERLGVQLWPNSRVTHIAADGVYVGQEHLSAESVIWAAGVRASELGADVSAERDPQGRVRVGVDLSVAGCPNVFVLGDQAHFAPPDRGAPLPGVASVAIQQGRHAARVIAADLEARPRPPFRYVDKGQMATIGRGRAIMQRGRFRAAGLFAWLAWLLVHVYFLIGFRNRVFVLLQWSWSYLTFARGARLITERGWRSYSKLDASTSRERSLSPVADLKQSAEEPRGREPSPEAGVVDSAGAVKAATAPAELDSLSSGPPPRGDAPEETDAGDFAPGSFEHLETDDEAWEEPTIAMDGLPPSDPPERPPSHPALSGSREAVRSAAPRLGGATAAGKPPPVAVGQRPRRPF